MSHILVIGATGMLREVVLHLAHLGIRVSAVARTWERLSLLHSAAGHMRGIVNPIALDYRDAATLRAALRNSILEFGPIDSTIAWVRSDAPQALRTVADCLGQPGALSAGKHKQTEAPLNRCDFLHLLGSASANSINSASPIAHELQTLPHINYRRIILGFMHEDDSSRWLTNYEISQGVLSALQSTDSTFTIGQLEPWAARPSA